MNIKILASILAIGLLAGCATKTENVPSNGNMNNAADNKAAQIQEVNNDTDSMQKDVMIGKQYPNSYINETMSSIDGKTVVLRSIHFAFDKYSMSDEMQEIESTNVNVINTVNTSGDVKIKLEGSTDEWGTDEYNYALGLKRTKVVKSTMVNLGISKDNIVVVSYGESSPLCSNQTAACWKKNRRVDHRLYK